MQIFYGDGLDCRDGRHWTWSRTATGLFHPDHLDLSFYRWGDLWRSDRLEHPSTTSTERRNGAVGLRARRLNHCFWHDHGSRLDRHYRDHPYSGYWDLSRFETTWMRASLLRQPSSCRNCRSRSAAHFQGEDESALSWPSVQFAGSGPDFARAMGGRYVPW